MMDLNFKNGFWIPDNYPEKGERSLFDMWENFRNYCRNKGSFLEIVLLTEFNAIAQCYTGNEEGDDNQWFIKFKTAEDYTYFVMRFS